MYYCTVKAVLSGHPLNMAFHRGGLILKNDEKCHFMLEFITFIQNLVKNSTNINFGREIRLNFNQKVFLVLIEWFRFI